MKKECDKMKQIKKKKIKIIVLSLIICILSIQPQVMAEDTRIQEFEKYAQSQPMSSTFTDMVGTILGVVQTVGSLIAIISLIVLGIKYMMGSVEEKAEYKKTLMPYFIRSHNGMWNKQYFKCNI